jgi:hypothetical protein
MVLQIGYEISKTFVYNRNNLSALYTEHASSIDSFKESLLMDLKFEKYGPSIWQSIETWESCAMIKSKDLTHLEATIDILRDKIEGKTEPHVICNDDEMTLSQL